MRQKLHWFLEKKYVHEWLALGYDRGPFGFFLTIHTGSQLSIPTHQTGQLLPTLANMEGEESFEVGVIIFYIDSANSMLF